MKTNLSEIQDTYKEYFEDRRFAARESCPPPETILRCLRSDKFTRQKSKTIDHLTKCGACAREAKVILDISKEENRFLRQIEDFMNSRRRQRPREKKTHFWRLSWNSIAVVSFIILTTAVVASSLLWLSSRSDSRRGTRPEMQLVSPVNQSLPVAQLKFVWQSFPRAKYYVIETFDATLDLVWRSEPIRLNEAYPPQAMIQRFKPDETYTWMVTAVLENGDQIKSRQKEFRIGR